MSQSPPSSASASRIPRLSGSPRSIPISNLSNLSLLSESSTGSWERGRMHGNARSPPAHPNMLADKVAEGSPLRASHSQMHGGSRSNGQKDRSTVAVSSSGSMRPRQQREGYGFRPASGHTTPNGSGTASLFSPFSLVNANGSSSRNQTGLNTEREDRDEMDHLPDVRSMDQLREAVRSELTNGADEGIHVQSGTEGAGVQEGRGIADEEGLGWPGEFSTFSQGDTSAYIVKPSQRSFVCIQPPLKSPPTLPRYPQPSVPSLNVLARTLTVRVFFARPSDTPKP